LRRRDCGPSAPCASSRVRLEEPSPETNRTLTPFFTSQAPPLVGSKPIRQLRLPRMLRLRFAHVTRFTCPARTADDKPGKGLPPNDPGRLPSCPRPAGSRPRLRCLRPQDLNSLCTDRTDSPSFRRRPRQRFDEFLRASVTLISFELPCDFSSACRAMRPTDFCFPSLDYEHPRLVGS